MGVQDWILCTDKRLRWKRDKKGSMRAPAVLSCCSNFVTVVSAATFCATTAIWSGVVVSTKRAATVIFFLGAAGASPAELSPDVSAVLPTPAMADPTRSSRLPAPAVVTSNVSFSCSQQPTHQSVVQIGYLML